MKFGHDSWVSITPATEGKSTIWDAIRPLLYQGRIPVAGPFPSSMDSHGGVYWRVDASRITPEQYAGLLDELRKMHPQLPHKQAVELIKRMEVGVEMVSSLEIGGEDLQETLKKIVMVPRFLPGSVKVLPVIEESAPDLEDILEIKDEPQPQPKRLSDVMATYRKSLKTFIQRWFELFI